jgi:hypothetical protein
MKSKVTVVDEIDGEECLNAGRFVELAQWTDGQGEGPVPSLERASQRAREGAETRRSFAPFLPPVADAGLDGRCMGRTGPCGTAETFPLSNIQGRL